MLSEILSGRYLPWLIAACGVGLLSVRVGPGLAAITALVSCALFAFLLALVEWCANEDTASSQVFRFAGSVSRAAGLGRHFLCAITRTVRSKESSHF